MAEILDAAELPTCEQRLPCDGEPVVSVMAGCVHEHIVELTACQWHVESLANDAQFCGACVRADGHICELVLIKVDAHPRDYRGLFPGGPESVSAPPATHGHAGTPPNPPSTRTSPHMSDTDHTRNPRNEDA